MLKMLLLYDILLLLKECIKKPAYIMPLLKKQTRIVNVLKLFPAADLVLVSDSGVKNYQPVLCIIQKNL